MAQDLEGNRKHALISRWINGNAWVTGARSVDSQSKHQSELVLRRKEQTLLEVTKVDKRCLA